MNIESFNIISVGQELSILKFKDNLKIDCGLRFEAFETNGYIMVIYMNKMTKKEIEILKNQEINVRVIKESDSLILAMIRFGNEQIIFEIIFDPTAYNNYNRSMQLKLNNIINIVGVDSETNLVTMIRNINMSEGLRQEWIKSWEKAFKERESYSSKYKEWIADIRNRHSIIELWNKGVNVGKLGDN
jgi:hypothetical protein